METLRPHRNIQQRMRLVHLGGVLVGFLFAGILPLAQGQEGGTRLPSREEVLAQQSAFAREKREVLKRGTDKLFLPALLQRADQLAGAAAQALAQGRLLQAHGVYRQARWQLPYRSPEVPEHTAHVLGDLHIRHAGPVFDLAYSPDGKQLATAGSDRRVILWDLDNGHEILSYVGHGDAIRTLAYTPDGKLLASAGGDVNIKLWDPKTGKTQKVFKTEPAYVRTIVISPDGKYLFAGCSDRTLKIFEVDSANMKREIKDFRQPVEHLVFSPNGKILGAAVGDGQLRLWEYPKMVDNANQPEFWAHQDQEGASYHLAFSPDGSFLARSYANGIKLYQVPNPGTPAQPNPELRYIPPPTGAGGKQIRNSCAIFSKDGKTLFAGGSDGIIRLYDKDNGQLTGTFKGHNDAIADLQFNADGSQLASASLDHTVRLWAFDISSRSRIFSGHEGPVWMAQFSPDGLRIVSGSADNLVKIWDVGTGTVLHTLKGHTSPVTLAVYGPGGKTVLSGSGDGTLKIWDPGQGKLLRSIEAHQGTVTTADYSPNGKQIVSGGADRKVKVWDAEQGKEILSLEKVSSIPSFVLYRPDGKTIAVGFIDRQIALYDGATGKLLRTWEAHSEAVNALAFSPDGNRLASAGADQLVKVWDLQKPETPPIILKGHSGPVSSVAFRPTGTYLVSGGSNGVVKLWNLTDPKQLDAAQDFRGHRDWVSSVMFNKEGYYILSASVDKNIRLWELTNREIPLVSEHTGAVKAVTISPDGKLLASGATDKSIKLWDLSSGKELKTLRGHDGAVIALAFTPDGKTLISSGADRNIQRWNVETGEILAQQEGHKRNLLNFLSPVSLIRITPDGKQLLAWIPGNERFTKICIYDLNTGEQLLEDQDRGRNVQAVGFNAKGNLTALGAADGTVRLYKLEDKKLTIQPGGDWFLFEKDVPITALAVNAGGDILIAGNDRGEIKIGDTEKRAVRHNAKGHEGKIRRIVFSADGKRFATTGDDNTIILWETSSAKQLRKWSIPVPMQVNDCFIADMAFTSQGQALVTGNANTTLFALEQP